MLASFEARTGKEAWRAYRPKREQSYGWSTPFVWENPLRTEIVVAGDLSARSYDLTGKELWEIQKLTVNTTPTPLAAHGLLFVQSGYPGDALHPTFAIRPGASGNNLAPAGRGEQRLRGLAQSAARVVHDLGAGVRDYYYTLITQGFLVCHDAKTGRQIYGRRRIDVASNGFTASPWAYNGRFSP
jgi:hypothetical protein